MNWTEDEYAEYISKTKVRNKASVPLADLERNPCVIAKKKNEIKAFDKAVNITLHSRRHRLADSDGLCGKWVIDSFVQAGILRSDTPEEVKEVRFSQEKIGRDEEEETIIIIEEA